MLAKFKETETSLKAWNTQLSEECNALRIECEVLKQKLINREEFDPQQHASKDEKFQTMIEALQAEITILQSYKNKD